MFTPIRFPSATAASTKVFDAAGSGADADLAARGWRADVVRYLGGYGPGWYVALRDAAGHRFAEGEGDTEGEAYGEAYARALAVAEVAGLTAAQAIGATALADLRAAHDPEPCPLPLAA